MLRRGIAVCLLSCACGVAQAGVLYDGSVAGKPYPTDQNWTYLTNPLVGASAVQSWAGGVTTLDTTPEITDQAGYFSHIPGFGPNPAMPVLDRTGDGFTIRFRVKIAQETHVSSDRAGFSVIVLCSDPMGIEIAFWTDEIWAQSAAFTHAEGAPFDTTAGITEYDLAVKGGSYAVYTGGGKLFGGSLRGYPIVHPVYAETSFMFFGDDTTSAEGETQISYIEFLGTAVPEPGVLALLAARAVGVLRRRRRRG